MGLPRAERDLAWWLASALSAGLILSTFTRATLAGTEQEGAREPWWSLAPLTACDPPPIAAEGEHWVRNEVDAFILDRLAAVGLRPSPEADRRTLLRRLSFDLTGLPPTPEEFHAFLTDPRPDAYERQVERLLASPHYGERWGRHWLDVVHYADTHGFDKDKRRPNAWPYRDYVVASFNEDKPYSSFVSEQVAGDALAPGDPEHIVASGFIAAGPWDFVGHVELREGTRDKRIARSLDRDDMVANTMTTFASLTVHCARCHDHKFDPITTHDYYGLQAVFAGVERADRLFDQDAEVARQRLTLASEIHSLEQQLNALRARIEDQESPRTRELQAALSARREASGAAADKAPPHRTLGYHSEIETERDSTKWVQVDLGRSMSIESVHLVGSHEVYGGHEGPGFGFVPRFRVELCDDPDFESGVTVLADRTAADAPHPGDHPSTFKAPEGTRARHVRVTATRLWERTADYIFALGELAVVCDGQNVALGKAVSALDSIEASGAWGRAYLVDGVFGHSSFAELVAIAGGGESGSDPFNGLDEWLDLGSDIARLEAQLYEARLAAADAELRGLLEEHRARLGEARAALAALPPQSRVYAAAKDFTPEGAFTPPPDGQPRTIALLERGDVDATGAEIPPGSPAGIPGPSSSFALVDAADEGQRRAALARWIVDPRNPLTWRSIVNRVWGYHFGRCLVNTPNDFGRMGDLPSHPELLDWLAVKFRDQGQSFKDLQRRIVTSATYRQTSGHDAHSASVDSGNRLLWRMNRRRLDAESLRDSMLAVSGELDETRGGPGFDLFVFEDDHSPRYLYGQHDPSAPGSLRRSVYRFIVRSVPDPFFEVFDCADPSMSVPVRSVTTTAPQALALLNNPFVLARSQAFATRVEELEGDDARVQRAWLLAVGRAPGEFERSSSLKYLKDHGTTAFCRVLFNTSEFAVVD